MSQIHILYSVVSEFLSDDFTDKYCSMLPEYEQAKIRSFRKKSDRDVSLLGKVLLMKLLNQLGYPGSLVKKIRYDEFKRPVLPRSSIDFNISHSPPIVAVALSTEVKVGLDVELVKPLDNFGFDTFFRKEELDWMDGDYHRFYSLWTRKEALIKAAGKGVFHSLLDINALNDRSTIDGVEYQLYDIELYENFKAALAFQVSNKAQKVEPIIRHIPLNEIIID